MFIQRQTKINIIRNAILAWIWKSNISLAWLLFSLLAPLEVKFKNTLNPQIKYAIWFFFKSLLFHFLVYVYSKFWRNHYQWMVSRFDLFIFIVLQPKCLFTYILYQILVFLLVQLDLTKPRLHQIVDVSRLIVLMNLSVKSKCCWHL